MNFKRLVLGCIEADSLESSWRDLPDLHTFALLRSHNFNQKSLTFFREWNSMNTEFPSFSFSASNFAFFCECLMKFCPDFATKSRKEWRRSFRSAYSTACAWKVKLLVTSDVFRFFNWICENRSENCRNSEICENYSLSFISVLSHDGGYQNM